MSALRDPSEFPFTRRLEAAVEEVGAELARLGTGAFAESPDSLTTVSGEYDETGWLYYELWGAEGSTEGSAEGRARCPRTAELCASVPGMRNAGFSLLRPGTHLFPHRGEMDGVLRCHLPLVVPAGDAGLSIDGTTLRWERGRCLVFDDTHEHEAWNRADTDRIVLIVTFAPDAG